MPEVAIVKRHVAVRYAWYIAALWIIGCAAFYGDTIAWLTDGDGRSAKAPAVLSPVAVGSAACGACHAAQTEAWRRSHHALATQQVDAATVPPQALTALARKPANGASEVSVSKTATGPVAEITGADGKTQSLPLRYALGIYPLQQFLVEQAGGRLQALGLAWDARPSSEGGQRWFPLYPDRKLKPGDAMHWNGRDQNWNGMCAPCHSTGLHKNYDAQADRFATTWSEINVGCEACHGPASGHLQWAQGNEAQRTNDVSKGLTLQPRSAAALAWQFGDDGRGIAHASGAAAASISERNAEVNVCLPCHARREALRATPAAALSVLDNYAPHLLDPGLHHVDGQIDEEVFEVAAFQQSRMHQAGVTCANCHDPHSAKLKADGNALCGQCHLAARFDTPAHHHHGEGSVGAQCVSCHMPQKTYMGVHARRDHGLRVPRPDLSAELGVPNACNQCHRDRDPAWAQHALLQWSQNVAQRSQEAEFARAIAAGRRADPAANARLLSLAAQPDLGAMRRATALSLLRGRLSPEQVDQLHSAATGEDALLRLGAARALEALERSERAAIGPALLRDSTLAVRVEAARALAASPGLDASAQADLTRAVDEAIEADQATAERPESQLRLAQLYLRLGRVDAAEHALEAALLREPRGVASRVNLADLYRATGRDAQAEPLLREAAELAPDEALVWHARGLLAVRLGRRDQALQFLRHASALAPGEPDYTYAYALALFEAGKAADALQRIDAALRRNPNAQELVRLRASIVRQQ